jgi:rubredoxin
MYWSTVNYKWVCDECGQEFEVTLKQNVFGVNAGVNYKSLYCPKCKKKTMCKGIKK